MFTVLVGGVTQGMVLAKAQAILGPPKKWWQHLEPSNEVVARTSGSQVGFLEMFRSPSCQDSMRVAWGEWEGEAEVDTMVLPCTSGS